MNDETYFTKKVTLLMVIFTVLMVLLHAKSPERFGFELGWNFPVIYVITQLCRIAVPCFFFVSALLFYKDCKFYNIKQKLSRRIYTLLIPYLLWNALYVGVFMVLHSVPFFSQNMRTGASFSTMNEIVVAIIDSRHSDLWFVKDLIIFSLAAPCLWFITRNNVVSIVIFIISILYAVVDVPPYKSVLTWFPCYMLGAIAGSNYERFDILIEHLRKSGYLYFVLLAFFLLFVASFVNPHTELGFVLFSPLLIWSLIEFIHRYLVSDFKKQKWMSYMFFIYVTHHFALNVLQKIVVISCPSTTLVIYLTYILSPIVVIWLLIKCANLISHTKVYKIMCGSR